MPGTVDRKANRRQRAAHGHAVNEEPEADNAGGENEDLRRKDSDRSLSEKQKRGREVRIIPDAGGRPFGEAAKQRERAKRDDERWNAEQRHEQRIQAPGGHARGDRRGGGERDRPSRVTRRHSEDDGGQGEQR